MPLVSGAENDFAFLIPFAFFLLLDDLTTPIACLTNDFEALEFISSLSFKGGPEKKKLSVDWHSSGDRNTSSSEATAARTRTDRLQCDKRGCECGRDRKRNRVDGKKKTCTEQQQIAERAHFLKPLQKLFVFLNQEKTRGGRVFSVCAKMTTLCCWTWSSFQTACYSLFLQSWGCNCQFSFAVESLECVSDGKRLRPDSSNLSCGSVNFLCVHVFRRERIHIRHARKAVKGFSRNRRCRIIRNEDFL